MKKVWNWILFVGGIILTVITLGFFRKNNDTNDQEVDDIHVEPETFDNADNAADYVADIISDDDKDNNSE